MDEARTAARERILRFYADCGVTVHLAEAAQNRFADEQTTLQRTFDEEAGRAPPPLATTPGAAESLPAPHEEGGGVVVEDARLAAMGAATLGELADALRRFDGCALKASARTTCVGEGPADASLMLVGEAPGREEDEAGRPFVGRSGRLLEKMLAAIGLERSQVYITNVIPWRPPGNRTPSPIETATCEVFVRREIALVRPQVLVLLGGAAARTLLRTDEGIMRQRGRWTTFAAADDVSIEAMATFHPAYLLRTPTAKREAWRDLLAIKERLRSTAA